MIFEEDDWNDPMMPELMEGNYNHSDSESGETFDRDAVELE
jgi:hypothetical protein